MSTRTDSARSLRKQVLQIEEEAGTSAVAVAFHDYETRTEWSYHAERWFHAASTIKIPVLLGVYAQIHAGRLAPHSRVHVRNRFVSVLDGESYRVGAERDANSAVHAAIGRTMSVAELARHMITTSSNLATNVLIELIGVEQIRTTLDELRLRGIEFVRGVEDERAHEAGIDNRITAEGLLHALRLIAEEEAFSAELSREMLEILHLQEFRSGIPAGLPEDARVAHKTGEISTVAHDAGIVYLPEREPYAVVVLTEYAEPGINRRETIARISRAVYTHLVADEEADE